MAVDDYEVYVNAEAIIEICRGPNMTVAQAFGEDWQAAPIVHVHPAALQGVIAAEPPRFVGEELPEGWRTPTPAWKPPDPPDRRIFYACVLVLAGLSAWAILAVSR